MLVLFDADKMTCILPTNKVKSIIGGNQILSEGSRVEILYEGDLFEAQVLKLHGEFYFIKSECYNSVACSCSHALCFVLGGSKSRLVARLGDDGFPKAVLDTSMLWLVFSFIP